jgi:hypothetical protein
MIVKRHAIAGATQCRRDKTSGMIGAVEMKVALRKFNVPIPQLVTTFSHHFDTIGLGRRGVSRHTQGKA